jgi:tRNA-dihydrouridine synthase B
MYKVESTAEQAIVVENYFNQLLAEGDLMSDVQVEQINLLQTH